MASARPVTATVQHEREPTHLQKPRATRPLHTRQNTTAGDSPTPYVRGGFEHHPRTPPTHRPHGPPQPHLHVPLSLPHHQRSLNTFSPVRVDDHTIAPLGSTRVPPRRTLGPGSPRPCSPGRDVAFTRPSRLSLDTPRRRTYRGLRGSFRGRGGGGHLGRTVLGWCRGSRRVLLFLDLNLDLSSQPRLPLMHGGHYRQPLHHPWHVRRLHAWHERHLRPTSR